MEANDNTTSQMTPSGKPPKYDQHPPSKPEGLSFQTGETTTNLPLGIGDDPNTGGGGGRRRGEGFLAREIESKDPGAAQVGKPFFVHIAKAAQPIALCLVAFAGALHFMSPTERDAPAYVETVDKICTLLTFLSGSSLSIYSMNTQPCAGAAFYQKHMVSFGFLSALLPFILRLWFP